MARKKPGSKKKPMRSRKSGRKTQRLIDQNYAILKTL